MPVIELTDEQRRKARKVIDEIARNPDVTPHHFVDQWEAKPPVQQLEMVTEECRDVKVEKIIGVARQNVDRLENRRLFELLKKMHDGEYTYKPPLEVENPPHLEQIEGYYYVSSDGIHRTLAHKILGIDEMWAEVTVYR